MKIIESEPIAIPKASIAVVAANKGHLIVNGPCAGMILVTFAGRLIDGLYRGVLRVREATPDDDEVPVVKYSDIVPRHPADGCVEITAVDSADRMYADMTASETESEE